MVCACHAGGLSKVPTSKSGASLEVVSVHARARRCNLLNAPAPRLAVPRLAQDGNLTDPVETAAIFDKYQPMHVIHLAAQVGGLFANLKYKVGRCGLTPG